MKILITGGAGFVGSNFVHYLLDKYKEYEIYNLDLLTYAGNTENLKDIESNSRHHFFRGDIGDKDLLDEILDNGVEVIVNFAAETHVDRSFIDPDKFVQTNVMGTNNLLSKAREKKIQRLIHLSTPEIYGGSSPLKEGQFFTEESPHLPNNPYSASKASSDMLCRAYHESYGLPVLYTRFASAFGPYQYPEKLFPLCVTYAIQDKEIPIYGNGKARRNWIHANDICRAIDMIMTKGEPGKAYNIGSGHEMSNLELVQSVLDVLGKSSDLIKFVPDRPSHDWQYPLDSTRINTELGWELKYDFPDACKDTVNWYKENQDWWKSLEVLDYEEAYAKILDSKR